MPTSITGRAFATAASIVLLVVAATSVNAQDPDAMVRPTARAAFRAKPIHIDGRIEEGEWGAYAPVGDFVQSEPRPSEPASQRTELRVAYDEAALFVALRAFDSRPDSIARQMARRDDLDIYSDWIAVAVDSYFDRRTAFLFGVSPAGVQSDGFLYNDTESDLLWDAVWSSATTIDSLGWSVEMRIPLSQLRFSLPAAGQAPRWGIQVKREIARSGETSWWSPTPPNQPGIVSRFGTLVGLDSLATPQRLEVTPYVSSQLTRRPGEGGDPFYDPTAASGRVGADVRYGLPQGLTLTATVNPDFGQVEVDPAVVNLSAFEVFFPERRPFFLEGIDIFRFGQTVTFNDNNPSNFFYTRRIGRAPRRSLSALGAVYQDAPAQSEILAAAKLSGKTSRGLSLGLLGAMTREMTGRYALPGGERRSAVVEPRTEFFVARTRQDFRRGNTVVGGAITGVRRELGGDELARLFVRDAVVGGIDWEHRWRDRSWAVSGSFNGSRVGADANVITALQRAPIRLFQRPDAERLSLDSARTSLDGHFATLSLARTAGQHWLGSVTYEETSPGFEVNDLGFQTRSDFRSVSSALIYRETRIGSLFRNYSLSLFATDAYNFDGDHVERRVSFLGEHQFNNFWSLNYWAFVQPETADDRLLRGGPTTRKPREWQIRGEIESDDRRAAIAELGFEWNANAQREWRHQVELGLELRPTSAMRVRLEPQYIRQYDVDQYVTAVGDPLAAATFGRRYVFGELRQDELSLESRVEWTFSPRLTLQLWAQPFVSSGRFLRYKEFTTPGEFAFATYGADRGLIVRGTDGGETVTVDPDGSGNAAPFSFEEQDFLVRSLRGNAVLRWEYRPGSTLFLVWQQQREGFDPSADLRATRDVSRVFRDPARNVFLVKVSYWLGR